MIVILQTIMGDHVGTFEIIPFQLAPEIMMWGQRLFVIDKEASSDEGQVYKEACMWVLMEDATCKKVG